MVNIYLKIGLRKLIEVIFKDMILIHRIEVNLSEYRICYKLLIGGIAYLSKISLILFKSLRELSSENVPISIFTVITGKPRISEIDKVCW